MKVDIYYYRQNIINEKISHDTTPTYLGFVLVDNFDKEEIFHLCNWSCWSTTKPANLYANIDTCYHGLCLINPETHERWLAKSFGWLIGSEDEINKYVLDNRHNIMWK